MQWYHQATCANMLTSSDAPDRLQAGGLKQPMSYTSKWGTKRQWFSIEDAHAVEMWAFTQVSRTCALDSWDNGTAPEICHCRAGSGMVGKPAYLLHCYTASQVAGVGSGWSFSLFCFLCFCVFCVWTGAEDMELTKVNSNAGQVASHHTGRV